MEFHHHIVGVFIDDIPTIASYANIRGEVQKRSMNSHKTHEVFPDEPLLKDNDFLAPDYFYSFEYCPKCGYKIPWDLLLVHTANYDPAGKVRSRRQSGEYDRGIVMVFVDPDDPVPNPNPYLRTK